MKGLRLIKKIAQNKQGRIGLIILLVLVVIAVFAPVIAPFDPYDVTMRDAKGLAPGRSHLLGTTITTGQDVFSMLIYGTRVSLGIGIITGIAISILGSLLGVAAGYLGRAADMIIMRIVDVMLVIPTLPLTILITNIFGKSLNELVNEGLQAKLMHMPAEARTRLQQTLERIINDGCDGLICILL
mgnify:CR=1 FL=1